MRSNWISRKEQIQETFPFFAGILLGTFMFFLSASGALQAQCIDLADEPLEIQSLGAPGMVMFVYDNSGSMGWSMMTNEDEGQFHYGGTTYSYLYDGESPNSTWKELYDDAARRMLWKTQWAEYNKVYYNPSVSYEPWPAWTEVADIQHPVPNAAPQADTDNPLLYVVRDNHGETFNLNDTWATIDIGGGASVCDLLDPAQNPNAIIVDNIDTGSVREVAVDDEGDGVDEPGFIYDGSSWRWNKWDDDFDFYGSDYMNYYGNTNPLPVSATWKFDIYTAGEYEVWVSVPKHFNRTKKANYTITHSGGTTDKTISQYYRYGLIQEWESLGTYDFNAGTDAGQVVLNFTSTQFGGSIAVDAIRLVPTFSIGDPDNYFSSTGPWVEASTATGYYGSDYLYTDMAGDYTATWKAENLSPGTDYSAYVRWGSNNNRATDATYTVDGDNVTINQRINDISDCYWKLLKDNISFHQDTGIVELNHYCSQYAGDSVSADAVAFVPTPESADTSVDIIMAHYFVQNANGTFLVNLDGAIDYYRFDDDGDNLVEDGELTKMYPADVAAAGIDTGRSYAEERQNFANWFQFSRTRDHVARYALAKLVEAMGNIYFGLMTVPPRDVYAIRAVKEAKVIHRDDTLEIYNNIYNMPDPSSSTPLKDSFLQVAEYFEGAASLVNAHDKAYFIDGGYADSDTYPYLNETHGGHCQQAFLIAMTDGFYNMNNASNIPNHDGDGNTEWDGGEFGDEFINTLADISMDFYERDLKDMLADEVPTNEWDQNQQQHLVTYALSFGITGSIDPDNWPECGWGGECPDWPQPVAGELTTIDDLYHATVNGRGMFLNAGNPQELVDALMKIKENIEERLGSAAAVSTNSVQRRIGSKVYQGVYTTGKWTGDLRAYNIDVSSGSVDTDNLAWSAQEEIDDFLETQGHAQRSIYSYNGSSGIKFDYTQMSEDQKERLENGLVAAFGTDTVSDDTDAVDNPELVENLVNYIRGDTSNNIANGGPFRTRSNPLGDIVHSEAEYDDEVLYVGGNDGMLHAFHSETGQELGAYVPNMLYGELAHLANPDYSHQYFIDNSPFFKNTGTQKLLVCPMGKGYKGLFMLDVSAPPGEAEQIGLWEYDGPGAGDDDLGYTFSRATIANTEAAGWVVITGNGYDSTNGHAVLYVFDALTGDVLKKLDTGVGDCNGLSSPALIDPDSDGIVDFAFAGDLKGNMWKFDLRGDAVSGWKIAFSSGDTPKPLISVTDPSGNPQPITQIPDVMFVRKCNPPGSKGYLVAFGTGKYLGITDLNDGSQQSVYAVYDWSEDWARAEAEPDQDPATVNTEDKYLGAFDAARALANASSKAGTTLSLVQQTVSATKSTVNGETYRFISDNPVIYYNVEADEGEALGWYMNLPDYGERMVRRPSIRNNILLFVANTPEDSVCSEGGTSVFYQVNACTGGWPDDPQFDTDGDGDFDEDDLTDGVPPIGKEYDAMLLDPTTIGDDVYLPSAIPPAPGTPGTPPDKIFKEDLPPRRNLLFWHVVE